MVFTIIIMLSMDNVIRRLGKPKCFFVVVFIKFSKRKTDNFEFKTGNQGIKFVIVL